MVIPAAEQSLRLIVLFRNSIKLAFIKSIFKKRPLQPILNRLPPQSPVDPPIFGEPIPDRFSHNGPVAFWLLVIAPQAPRHEIDLIGPKSSFAGFMPEISKRLKWDPEARDKFETLRYRIDDNGQKALDPGFDKHGFIDDFHFKDALKGASVFKLLVCSPLGGHVCRPEKCHTALFAYMPLVRNDQDLTFWGKNERWVDPRVLPGFMDYTYALGHFGSVKEAKAHGDKVIMFNGGVKALYHGWTSFTAGSRYERYGWSETHAMKVYVCEDKNVS
ncbi:hypothetical protein IQ07DRAFT_647046 [Pyrenochaeta sp. DS3sAY3a]|nr:hypothetical protein IQ07DRAFT_647046 [Pyrenochaeta sp. DS3sAY3a]